MEFTEGSTIKSEDESVIYLPSLIANNLQAELSEAAAPIVDNDNVGSATAMVGQQVNVTYTYIDLATASRQSHSEVYTVAGIMKPVGNPTIDRAVVFNLEAGNKLFQKSGRYDSLFVAAESTDHVTQVEKEIRDIYGSDIGITTSQAILQSIGEFTAGFGTAISSIALVALLVGSVGIVTTMYTSVTERTREIGLMKADWREKPKCSCSVSHRVSPNWDYWRKHRTWGGRAWGVWCFVSFCFDSIGPSELTPYYSWIDLARIWALSLGLSVRLVSTPPGRHPSYRQ